MEAYSLQHEYRTVRLQESALIARIINKSLQTVMQKSTVRYGTVRYGKGNGTVPVRNQYGTGTVPYRIFPHGAGRAQGLIRIDEG